MIELDKDGNGEFLGWKIKIIPRDMEVTATWMIDCNTRWNYYLTIDEAILAVVADIHCTNLSRSNNRLSWLS